MKSVKASQDLKSLIISYAVYRVWLAILTYGVLIIYDYLNYRNTSLSASSEKIDISKGVSSTPFSVDVKIIKAIESQQSSIGKAFGYGSILIHTQSNAIHKVSFISNASSVCDQLLLLTRHSNTIIQSGTELAESKKAAELAKEEEKYEEMGKCPKCRSERIMPLQTSASVKGTGFSRTMRMCMRCGKKFN